MNFMYKSFELSNDPILAKWEKRDVLTEEKIKEKEKEVLDFHEKFLKIEIANQFASPIIATEPEQQIEEEEEEEDEISPDSPEIDPF